MVFVTAWLCEFARADGFAGFVRLDVRDTIAWYWTYLVGVPGVDGIVTVRDHEVRPPRPGRLEIRADGLWAELWCEQSGEHWTFGLEAFGVRLDAPEEALRAGGEIGERVAVGLDLEWELGEPAHADVVHGEVLVARDRFPIDAWGRFVDGHELCDDVVDGDEVARVLIPLGNDEVCERTLVRDATGALRWSQAIRSR